MSDRRRGRAHTLSEELPFIVKITRLTSELPEVVRTRDTLFATRYPYLPPEQLYIGTDRFDSQRHHLVIYIVSKVNQSVLGSVRIATNSERPLRLELDLVNGLPKPWGNSHLAYISRFNVERCADERLVNLALLKAVDLYCHSKQAHMMIIAAPKPTDRVWKKIGFTDLYKGEDSFVLEGYPTPVRVLGSSLQRVREKINETDKEAFHFMYEAYHADFKIFDSVSGVWERPRSV